MKDIERDVDKLIIEVIKPDEAAKRGLPPKEYVELGVQPGEYESLEGHTAVAAVMFELDIKEMTVMFPKFVSSRGNVVVEIERDNGPKATVKDHIVYLSKKVSQTLRRG